MKYGIAECGHLLVPTSRRVWVFVPFARVVLQTERYTSNIGNIGPAVANFLLIRGEYAYISTSWVGCASMENRHIYDWNVEWLDVDYWSEQCAVARDFGDVFDRLCGVAVCSLIIPARRRATDLGALSASGAMRPCRWTATAVGAVGQVQTMSSHV